MLMTTWVSVKHLYSTEQFFSFYFHHAMVKVQGFLHLRSVGMFLKPRNKIGQIFPPTTSLSSTTSSTTVDHLQHGVLISQWQCQPSSLNKHYIMVWQSLKWRNSKSNTVWRINRQKDSQDTSSVFEILARRMLLLAPSVCAKGRRKH